MPGKGALLKGSSFYFKNGEGVCYAGNKESLNLFYKLHIKGLHAF